MKAWTSSLWLATLCSAALPSCQSAYYSTMEQFGVHKRDILVDRVEEGREEQAEAQEQFQTTLEAFQSLTGFEGGDLEKVYKKLNSEYESSEESAEAVRERVSSIEKVSADLFREWQEEIDTMSAADLRSKSQTMLADTQARYEQLISKMRQASEHMDPVLVAFRDHVLVLKHNLNAQAIDSLRDTSIEIESDVSELIEAMQASIDEADAFIASMSS